METSVSNEALFKSIEELTKKIDQITKESFYKTSYQSKETSELNTSLASAFQEYPAIYFNRQDGYFKNQYADLDKIMAKIRPVLAKHGLCVTNRTILNAEGETVLETRIWHSSGQWMETRARLIPTKNDAHTYASALLHLTRLQIMSILNVTIADNPDDDNAEMQMASARQILAKGTSSNRNYSPKKESSEPITREQLEELEYELQNCPEFVEEIMDTYRIQSLADLPKSKYRTAITRTREIKLLRDGRKIEIGTK